MKLKLAKLQGTLLMLVLLFTDASVNLPNESDRRLEVAQVDSGGVVGGIPEIGGNPKGQVNPELGEEAQRAGEAVQNVGEEAQRAGEAVQNAGEEAQKAGQRRLRRLGR